MTDANERDPSVCIQSRTQKHAGTMTSSGNNRRIHDISLHQTQLPRFHAEIFNEMHPTVSISSKNKDYIFQNQTSYKLDHDLSDQRPYTIYKQSVCVLTKGERVSC